MTQSDFFFTPRAVTVHTGDRLTISNVSPSSPHTFTISSKGIDVVNNPGQSQAITINLSPGSYPFVCTFHQALGMTGTLIVSAPGKTPAPAVVAAAARSIPSPAPSGPSAGPSGTSPVPSSLASGQTGPGVGAAGGQATGQTGSGGFPLGTLVIVGALLALTAGAASLGFVLWNRSRAPGGG